MGRIWRPGDRFSKALITQSGFATVIIQIWPWCLGSLLLTYLDFNLIVDKKLHPL